MAEQAEIQTTTVDEIHRGVDTRELAKRSFASQAWFFVRRWPLIPLIIMVLLLITGLFAPLVAPADPISQSLGFRNFPPTWGRANPEYNVVPVEADFDVETTQGRTAFSRAKKNSFPRNKYVLGADNLGRDVLSRVVFGARISLQVTGWALTSGIIIGTLLGLLAGYFGGWTDEILMRLVDVFLALPFILIALVIAQIFLKQGGASLGVVIFIIALVAWTPFVRQVRADVLTIRSQDYVMSARVAGASNVRVIIRHILPGTFSTILVVASLRVGQLILTEATLSFLGAGIPDPIPAWGKSVNDGRAFIEEAWWISFWPGFAIFLVVMSLNFFGDWLRDRLDPRLRQLD
ncbi:MAG: ABC transporter permease [Chloroflexi bacterium]|nr:ABC transporter permease [Chloroflexota bacterium]MCH8114467.1 ABC transporter permease [Chloroflexota bacterium]MCI0833525.1 ABC transporter permease [Chloroflexota bacterium]